MFPLSSGWYSHIPHTICLFRVDRKTSSHTSLLFNMVQMKLRPGLVFITLQVATAVVAPTAALPLPAEHKFYLNNVAFTPEDMNYLSQELSRSILNNPSQ